MLYLLYIYVAVYYMYIYIYFFFFSLFIMQNYDGQSARNVFYEVKVCIFFFLNKDVELLFVRFRLLIEAARQAAQSFQNILCVTTK